MPSIITRGTASAQAYGYILSRKIEDPATDPFWSSVIALLHMDGVDASTTIVDAASKSEVTVVGAGALSTNAPKFGDACLSVPASPSGASCVFPQAIGTSDFTIELWLKVNDVSSYQTFYDQRPVGGAVAPWLYLQLDRVVYQVEGTGIIISSPIGDAEKSVKPGVWTPIAVSRVSGITYLFVNGIQVAQVADTSNYVGLSANIGANRFNSTYNMLGYVDEVRVSLVGRYAGTTYNVRSSPFPEISG